MQLATDLRPSLLRDFHWGASGRGLVLVLDDPAGQRRGVAWLDLRSGTVTRLTPELSSDARYVGQVSEPKPRILVSVRHPLSRGLVLQDVTTTGEVLAEWEGPDSPVGLWLATATQAIAVCFGEKTCTWWHGRLPEPSWSCIAELPATDARASHPIAFSSDGNSLFATSCADRDTIALVRMAPPAWAAEVLSQNERFDITSVLMSPDGAGPDVVTTTDADSPQSALTSGAAADLSRLRHLAGDAPARIIGRNASHCLAEISYPVGGPAYLMFSRSTKAVSRPLVRYTGLARIRVHKREPFTYLARDGRLITGFLTIPPGSAPWPAVLVVHDGPWSRDEAHMDPWAQYLASAGLCCIQVNYRGSRGFGKAFRDAGDGQWSLAMQDDLVDALASDSVSEVADSDRIAAIGHGYGGYAAVMLTTQSEVALSCAVSASAPTDLVRYASSLMAFGGRSGFAYAARMGDPERDRHKLTRASPVARVADIGAPLLLFHGRQDACVPISHAQTFADSLRRAGKEYQLIAYEDEGHWYSRPQNVADFRLRTVEFLLSTLSAPVDSAAR